MSPIANDEPSKEFSKLVVAPGRREQRKTRFNGPLLLQLILKGENAHGNNSREMAVRVPSRLGTEERHLQRAEVQGTMDAVVTGRIQETV